MFRKILAQEGNKGIKIEDNEEVQSDEVSELGGTIKNE